MYKRQELDGKSVVFGQITSGLDELMDVIQYTETDEYGKPQHELRFLYFVLEILKISNILDLHATYTEKNGKFRNGDTSVGSTLKDIFPKDKGYTTSTSAFTKTTAFDLNHPVSRALMCLTCLLYTSRCV